MLNKRLFTYVVFVVAGGITGAFLAKIMAFIIAYGFNDPRPSDLNLIISMLIGGIIGGIKGVFAARSYLKHGRKQPF